MSKMIHYIEERNFRLKQKIAKTTGLTWTVAGTSVLNLENTYLYALDRMGVTNFLDCLYSFNTDQENFSRIDYIDNNRIANYSGGTWATGAGVSGNATDKTVELLLNLAATTHFTVLNSGMVVCFETMGTAVASSVIVGHENGNRCLIFDGSTTYTARIGGNGFSAANSRLTTLSTVALIRVATGTFEIYVNGVLDETVTASYTGYSANSWCWLFSAAGSANWSNGQIHGIMYGQGNRIRNNIAGIHTAMINRYT